ncbi:TPA: hypothetical protein ACH3X1_016033 [Trebouxia sp. C0004]
MEGSFRLSKPLRNWHEETFINLSVCASEFRHKTNGSCPVLSSGRSGAYNPPTLQHHSRDTHFCYSGGKPVRC